MTTSSDLKTMANNTPTRRYRMVVESTSIDVIKTALQMYPNAIIVDTHRGFLIAVPVTPDDPDKNRI